MINDDVEDENDDEKDGDEKNDNNDDDDDNKWPDDMMTIIMPKTKMRMNYEDEKNDNNDDDDDNKWPDDMSVWWERREAILREICPETMPRLCLLQTSGDIPC